MMYWMMSAIALAFTVRALIVAKRRGAKLPRLIVIGILGAFTASIPFIFKALGG